MADGVTLITRLGREAPELACSGNDSPTWALFPAPQRAPSRSWVPRSKSTIVDDGLLLWLLEVARDPDVIAAADAAGFPRQLERLVLAELPASAYEPVIACARAASTMAGACLVFDQLGWGSASIRAVEHYAASVPVLEIVYERREDAWGAGAYSARSFVGARG